MSLRGNAAVAMWWDVPAEVRAEWEEWHTSEHMPERLRIPGFQRGTRWVALSGEPSYFVLYEVAEPAILTSGPYLARLNDPTPWSREMMPHHRNMTRSLCRVRASHGGGLAHVVATVRPGKEAAAPLPALVRGKGITSACLLESLPAAVPQTAEQKIRGKDAQVDWALVIGGYEAGPVCAAAGKLGGIAGLYRLSYSLAAGEMP